MIRYPGCVSFARSLDVMHIRDVPGAYGVDTDEYGCELCWSWRQRDGWLQELLNAQTAIERELGDNFLCPREICDEVHLAASEIKLKHPLNALGRYAYTEWQSADVTYADDPLTVQSMGVVEICDTSLVIDGVTYSVDDIEFDYPAAIAECYNGLQEIQAPCVVGHFDASEGCPGGGTTFQWYVYQLVNPLLPEYPVESQESNNCVSLADTDSFIDSIRFRFRYIDDEAAVTLVGQCSCGSGCDTAGVTAEIIDAVEGILCLTGSVCGRGSRVKIDYISAYRCADAPDPLLEKSVVVLAIAYAGESIAKPCECDNSWIDQWGKVDDTTRGEIPSRLRYGNTVGGMFALRSVNQFLASDNKKKAGTTPVVSRGKFKTYLSRFM